MFGLDEWIAHASDGTTLALVVLVAIVLGLRHASDPDHVAAVTTLVAGGGGSGARLGLTWGAGHATSLLLFGTPIVLWKSYLPPLVEKGAEVTIGIVIALLALALLRRHRHAHVQTRTAGQAYAIGVVHGVGGTGGVGVLLLATIHSQPVALAALTLFAAGTALSMAVLSRAYGAALARPGIRARLHQVAPALGVASLAFGVWYTRGAASYDARRAKAQTWLLTIVHRRAVDLVRRENRRRGAPLEDAPVAAGDATDEEAWVRERRREVQAALAQLPADQREALELAYYGGLTQSELAERLGVPLGTIKSRMFTGLSRLRDLLADAGFEEASLL